jgi:phosphomannomutase
MQERETMIEPSIFKAYDIRGLYPEQINGRVAERIGRAFVDYLGAKRVAVGRDTRLSSPEIAAGLVAGARSQGAEVTDLGVVSTDMMYYSVARHDMDGGAIVTASHNPKEWNGAKLVRRGALALSGDAGIKEIREALVAGRFAAAEGEPGPPPRSYRIVEEYAQHCLSFIDIARLRPLKVVLDAGNGMGSLGAEAILRHLPLEQIRMYFELDGSFPNHPPDPLQEENRREIAARVVAEKADLGIAWDGDADRCFFIDDTGAFVPGDFVTALLGESFAMKEQGARIVYDVRASRAVPDRITAAGGRPLIHRVGHAFIKRRMRDENAAFGGEVSGHYYFRDNWYADNGMIPALLLLELLGRRGQPLSEILAALRQRYHITGEINSRVADVPAALRRIEERYRDGRIQHLDGISVDYDDWHFNVRPSNTEPLLRLNLEAYSADEMETRRDEVLRVIRGNDEPSVASARP